MFNYSYTFLIWTREFLTEIKILFSGSLTVWSRSVNRIQRFLLHLRYCVAVKNLDWHVLRVRIHSANKHGLLRYRDVNRLKLENCDGYYCTKHQLILLKYKYFFTIGLKSIDCRINFSSDKEYRASDVIASTGPLSTCCFTARNSTYNGSPAHSLMNLYKRNVNQAESIFSATLSVL